LEILIIAIEEFGVIDLRSDFFKLPTIPIEANLGIAR
jgi:hypothetical protein